MEKARLTEAQIRRIIYEELIDHYLTQRELWDAATPAQATGSAPRRMNNGGRTA